MGSQVLISGIWYYSFSHAINIQHLIAPPELMTPYVIYWKDENPTPVPYSAPTQVEAVEQSLKARNERSAGDTGWAAGREGIIDLGANGKHDVLMFEGFVPGLAPPLEMFIYYRREPFRLIHAFLWKTHTQVKQTPEASQRFMKEFKRGILHHAFGARCVEYIDQAEPFPGTR